MWKAGWPALSLIPIFPASMKQAGAAWQKWLQRSAEQEMVLHRSGWWSAIRGRPWSWLILPVCRSWNEDREKLHAVNVNGVEFWLWPKDRNFCYVDQTWFPDLDPSWVKYKRFQNLFDASLHSLSRWRIIKIILYFAQMAGPYPKNFHTNPI